MIRAFSQRLNPPFSGQVQIAQSDTYRALTLDGSMWEVQYVKRIHVRVGNFSASELKSRTFSAEQLDEAVAEPELLALLEYLADVRLPFPGNDHFEYWLLDKNDKAPLALIYACAEEEQMSKFPSRAEWASLPDAVMAVEKTEAEITAQTPPVNYRLERQVAERGGMYSKAEWFDRRKDDEHFFPPLLVREDWDEPVEADICKRYIERQAPRLLMLHGLSESDRDRLERCCEPNAAEVARFCGLYPNVLNTELIKALQVEARLRASTGIKKHSDVQNRRDGICRVIYIRAVNYTNATSQNM